MKFNRLILCVLTLLMTVVASAHDGHDHTAPEAPLIHLLWIIPGIIALAIWAGRIYLNSLTKIYNIPQRKSDKF